MNEFVRTALLAALLAAALPAAAADPAVADKARSAATQLKHKAQLVTLCERCAIVEKTHRITRQGDAKGVGAVGGAVAGGVVGKSTTDSTMGAVGGAVIGGVLGHQIEKRVKREKVWITTVTLKDGSQRDFEADQDPKWAAGTVVEVDGKKLRKH